MWRPFSSRTRSLFLFSLQSSSSSTTLTASPFIVRSSHFSSSSTYSSTYSSNVKVKAWWDFDTCKLPTGVTVSEVLPIITAALKANEINGPIEMKAYGNIRNLSKENQEAILSCGKENEEAILCSGIEFEHVEPKDPLEYGRYQNGVYRTIVCDLNLWSDENVPPWHLFFISGYDNLACHFFELMEENYNVLVASTGPDKEEICSAANMAWDWDCLMRGQNLIVPRRNFPDDFPEDEDCFSSSEKLTSLNREEKKEEALS